MLMILRNARVRPRWRWVGDLVQLRGDDGTRTHDPLLAKQVL